MQNLNQGYLNIIGILKKLYYEMILAVNHIQRKSTNP